MPDRDLELLVRSLAHDLNNVLSEILGHAGLLEADPADQEEVAESAAAIRRATERAAELARRLTSLRLLGGNARGRADIHEIAGEVAGLMNRTLPPEIRLSQELRAGQPVIQGDPGSLHEMLLNLALNARDAMDSGGELRFATSDDGEAGVLVTVSDTGHGIDPALRERVFEPFFTTKQGSGKSGLGLAIARRIVESHGGRIDIESEPGRGTLVRVFLPRG